jgi:hypothetical protein
MLQISEWLPNPQGADTKSEWIEFQNTGTGFVNTSGWFLKNEKGKSAVLPSRNVGPGEFLIFKKPELSLTFRNTNGGVSLYDDSGNLVEHEEFLGIAPEDKTFGRTDHGFSWLSPTPGLKNAETVSLANTSQPFNIPLNSTSLSVLPFIFFPILITAFLLYTVKQDEGLSHILLGGDEGDSQDESLAYTLIDETEDQENRDNLSSKWRAWSWED